MLILDRAKRDPAFGRRFAVAIIFVQTLLGAAAQILMKSGTRTQQDESPLGLIVAIFTTPGLFAGYALYGISTVLMVAAFKYGELSILYPIISLSYVWVTGLSMMMFGESLTAIKLGGLVTVMLGVAVLGRSGKS